MPEEAVILPKFSRFGKRKRKESVCWILFKVETFLFTVFDESTSCNWIWLEVGASSFDAMLLVFVLNFHEFDK